MWRKVATFMMYESVGLALTCTAYLLPRQPGPAIPAFLFVVGIMSCFTGLGYGLSLFPRTRAASFHHWTGRVTAPTTGKQEAVWVVTGTVRTKGGHSAGDAGGGFGH
jgi:hypothetical protein